MATIDRNITNERIDTTSVTLDQVFELVSFHNSNYGTNRKVDHWLWQYTGYDASKSVFTIARDHFKLIATQAMMPYYLTTKNGDILSGKSENTLLLLQYRNIGIMEKLYEYAVEYCGNCGMKLLWGFTPAVKAFSKFRFTSYEALETYEKPGLNFLYGIVSRFKQKDKAWRKYGSIGKYLVKYLLAIKRIPEVEKKSGYEVSYERIGLNSFDKLYSRLRIQSPDMITLPYDERFLAWRIRRHPFFNYREYQVMHGKELRAYAFVVLNQGTLYISDLTSEDNHSTHILLYKILKDYFKYTEKFIIKVNPTDVLAQGEIMVLKKLGFIPCQTENLVLRLLSDENLEVFKTISNWHINGLWTEGYKM